MAQLDPWGNLTRTTLAARLRKEYENWGQRITRLTFCVFFPSGSLSSARSFHPLDSAVLRERDPSLLARCFRLRAVGMGATNLRLMTGNLANREL